MKKKISIIIAILLFLVLIRYIYLHFEHTKELMIWLKDGLGWKALLFGGIVYMFLLSIPFFPGVELGWLLILLFGKTAVILVYFFTLCGLSMSFIIGRWFEKSWLTSWLDIDSLKSLFRERAVSVTKQQNILGIPQLSNVPFEKYFYKYRYLIVAVLINTPGNAIIGGGGGIAFIIGMNRIFSWKGFFLTMALAISPLPLLLYFGLVQIETLLS